MDSTTRQAAVMRDDDPSQDCPASTEVKIDAGGPAVSKGDSNQKSRKAKAKKKTSTSAKNVSANSKKGTKYKPRKSRKNDKGSSRNSTDATDDDGSVSTSESDDTGPDVVVVRRRSPRKAPSRQQLKPKSHKKTNPVSSKFQSAHGSESGSSSSNTDLSASEDGESDGESNVDVRVRPTITLGKPRMDSIPSQDIGLQVAKELQRILQLAQTTGPSSHPAALNSHVGPNSGLGGGLDAGLGNSPPPPSHSQPGRGALGMLAAAAASYPGRPSQARPPPPRFAGRGEIDSFFDNPRGGRLDDPFLPSRTRQRRDSYPFRPAVGPVVEDKKKPKKLDYKRVDQVWDTSIHNYKLQDTTQAGVETKYDGFCFHVRRTFDWEGKFKATIIDIKSKVLRECLQDVIGNIKGVSLVDETPKLDPNILFLYLEDLRRYTKELKKQAASPSGPNKQERKKEAKRLEEKRQSLKVLVKYIDKDYDHVKKSLYPMLEHGLITFDLLWALWKPNTIVYTTTYGSHDEPRAFQVHTAEKHCHITKGEAYFVSGKYFEYDGKQFGYGHIIGEVPEFRGAKKITSLGLYPLKYHKNEEKLRAELIERGKKFVTLAGVHYKSHQGMAYYKRKKAIVKVNVNGRVMVDPSIHRRINPNYPISLVRPKDGESSEDDEDTDNDVDSTSDSDENGGEERVQYVTKLVKDPKGRMQLVRMPKDVAADMDKENLTKIEAAEIDSSGDEDEEAEAEGSKPVPKFSDDEYLTASSVVLGFSFGEKLWLELTVSGINDISWNDKAYESLVLEPKTKETVKALVESHKYHAASSIDDVIQGKGKGLVAVLHGPPGTGKTLTAEGISELLQCPLYMVSAGELGTDSRGLEAELQRILDICHAWGAILLLDEADVFLEKRNMHEIHRNALVSIFLRQLEYFQGILFLTTNRVETFDEAFQSRIHIALRYDPLDFRAKKTIFKMFVDRARAQQKEGDKEIVFTSADYDSLARHELNGRQIKNTIIRAQALAVNKGEPLDMVHVRQILEVQVSFDRDLKGGTGYQDAMRSYF